MNRFHAPEGSVTEANVRMAFNFNYEYMVPIETAWELEQELNKARAEIAELQRGRSKPPKAEGDQ
jgi:hypothetical protein